MNWNVITQEIAESTGAFSPKDRELVPVVFSCLIEWSVNAYERLNVLYIKQSYVQDLLQLSR